MTAAEAAQPRRRYDSALRRQQSAATRARIIEAGAELLHERPVWDLDALTIRAVAARAGVNERTVYRHFAGERELRDAVFTRLEEEAGVTLEGVGLEDLQAFTARVLAYVSTFPIEPRTLRDPTLMAAHGRLRDVLLDAVARANPAWTVRDRTIAAAVLDVCWSVTSYERLVADWHLDPKDAIAAASWVIGLIENAIRNDDRPPSRPR